MPGGGRGGSARGGPQSREVLVSKKLSWLLRHGAEKEGLVLGKGGYVGLSDVVSFLVSFFWCLGVVVLCAAVCCLGTSEEMSNGCIVED